MTISSTSPPFLLVAGEKTQHVIFTCFHSCNPQLLDKGTRWRSSRMHKEKKGNCPPLPELQDISSYLKNEKSGYSQVPVFSGKPTSSSSPYFLCSSCLSTGSTRKRHLKNVSSVGGCRHTATPLKLLQWRGLLFDGVVKLPESLESASDHSAPLLHVLPSIPLQTSSFQVDSLSDLPHSLSSTGLSFGLTSCVPLSALPPSLSSNDGESLSSSSSFAPSSMALIPRRNASDIAAMPEFAASRKRKRLTEEDILDEEGVPFLIPEWFQKQNIPSFFNFFIDFNVLRASSSSSSSSSSSPPAPPFKMSPVQSSALKEVLLSTSEGQEGVACPIFY